MDTGAEMMKDYCLRELKRTVQLLTENLRAKMLKIKFFQMIFRR